MKRDKQATMDKQFLDSRSYITLDGREVLYGEDWKARKFDLHLRSGGRCERMVPILENTALKERCRSVAHDPHHKTRRSKGRDDRLSNLEALCRLHHDLEDERKPRWTKRDHEPQFGASRKVETSGL